MAMLAILPLSSSTAFSAVPSAGWFKHETISPLKALAFQASHSSCLQFWNSRSMRGEAEVGGILGLLEWGLGGDGWDSQGCYLFYIF